MDAPAEKWAQAAAQRVLEYKLSAVYYCPVPAGIETAGIIARKFSLEPQLLPGFEEPGWLQWKGLSPEEVALIDCPLHEKGIGSDRIKFPFAGGLDQLREKVAAALDGLAERHKKETVAVVSHRALTVVMVLHFLHMNTRHYNQVAQESGAVNLFEVRGGMPSAIYVNDTCHLEGLI